MPLYSYECNTCKRVFEEFRRVEDREKEKDCDGDLDYKRKICTGKLIYQPLESMRGTNFYFNEKGKQYAS
jgi:putative FmdB family regulatory protein